MRAAVGLGGRHGFLAWAAEQCVYVGCVGWWEQLCVSFAAEVDGLAGGQQEVGAAKGQALGGAPPNASCAWGRLWRSRSSSRKQARLWTASWYRYDKSLLLVLQLCMWAWAWATAAVALLHASGCVHPCSYPGL